MDNEDEFGFIKANDAYHHVAEVIENYYNTTREVMPWKEAAQMVEDYYEAEAEKYLAIPKLEQRLKERYAPAKTEPEARQAQEEETKVSSDTPTKTLTNTQAQRAPGDKFKLSSREQSINEIASRYKFFK